MLITMLIAAVGANWTLSAAPPSDGRRSTLGFRREAFACLDVSNTAAATLLPNRRCQVNGDLFRRASPCHRTCSFVADEHEAEPCEKLYATDASPNGAGGLRPSQKEDWSPCTVWPKRGGELVRLDWRSEQPPSNMRDGRAPLAMWLNWTTMFLSPLLQGQAHRLISLLSRMTREGTRTRRLLVLQIHAWLREPSRMDDRAHEKSISCFENLGSGVLPVTSRWS